MRIVLATVQLTHAALTNLVTRGTGGVINVASVAGFGQSPGSVSYCATKTWMNSFTEGLAMELAARKSLVKVQALCPGFTLSEFHDVAHMDRRTIPKSLWMTADFVVSESLRAFDKGTLFVVPGWRYKLMVALMRAIPRPVMYWISVTGGRRQSGAE
jgi:short-subunit dehydrogenase